jgi:imidazolonepropionase
MQADLIVRDCRQILTFRAQNAAGEPAGMDDPGVVSGGAIAIGDGKILAVGTEADILASYTASEHISAAGGIVLPGFVDCHSHPVFVHTREDEFAMRLQGKTYVDIALAGGGIRSTISSTREADEELLFELAARRIRKMISLGTTTLEAKSGYGLDTASELKQLRVIDRLAKELPIHIVPTFMGAHEFPAEYKDNHSAYIDILTDEMIPAVAEQGIAEFCDIFTEAHVYNLEESRIVLDCARKHGMKLKMHADEIEPMGGAELAAEMGCVSADHLGTTSEQGIEALAKAGVVPVLLPATLFSLRSKTYARGKDMIQRGLPVAIATDYNPGSCNCDSLPLTISLACLQMGFTPAEALTAATRNAARAVCREAQVGSLEPGKSADFTIWDIPSHNFIPYHLGSSYITSVYCKGVCVHRAAE